MYKTSLRMRLQRFLRRTVLSFCPKNQQTDGSEAGGKLRLPYFRTAKKGKFTGKYAGNSSGGIKNTEKMIFYETLLIKNADLEKMS